MKLYKQPNSYTCGTTCIKMLADHFKKTYNSRNYSFKRLKVICNNTKDGTEIRDINKALKELNLKRERVSSLIYGWHLTLIIDSVPNTDHYVLVKRSVFKNRVFIMDPYDGKYSIPDHVFDKLVRKYNNKPWIWRIT